MQPAKLTPEAQIFVCAHARPPGDPLASACGAHGPAVLEALRSLVRRSGRVRSVWVTRAACLGQCPGGGCAVAVYPRGEQWIDVRAEDAAALLDAALTAPRP
jgi:(2Fe-2S) ferredoxin